jgi:GNAT superfamily N-acetyltransferase
VVISKIRNQVKLCAELTIEIGRMDPSSSINIIRACPEEATVLTQIALAAKQHWNYPRDWIDGWCDALTITGEMIGRERFYVAALDNERLAFYGLMGGPPLLSLEHLWVLPNRIGQGIGRILFAHAIEQAKAAGASQVHIESDPHAEGFYLRMGARRIGERVSEMKGKKRRLPLLRMDLNGPGQDVHSET